MLRLSRALCLLFGICFTPLPVSATDFVESVELVNGDIIHGQVLSLDGTVLKLRSHSFGELSIERAKVASIQLVRPKTMSPTPAAVASTPTEPTMLEQVPSADDVLKELRAAGGVSPRELNALQQKFPMLAAPEVKDFLTERLSGLLTGRINLLDIRQDAVSAVEQIKDLQKDLGPQASALNGYLSILEKFIEETTPPPNRDQPPARDAAGNQRP